MSKIRDIQRVAPLGVRLSDQTFWDVLQDKSLTGTRCFANFQSSFLPEAVHILVELGVDL